MVKRIDITGQRFGRLTAIKDLHLTASGRAWLCRCDCGTEKVFTAGALRRGHNLSCGCHARAQIRTNNGIHERRCTMCHEFKPASDFNASPHSIDKLQSSCKPCMVQRGSLWNQANPGQQRARKYGLTTQEWDALFDKQGRACAICASPNPNFKHGFHTDHIKVNGRIVVRGILCKSCNIAMGHYDRTIAPRLKRIIAYASASRKAL